MRSVENFPFRGKFSEVYIHLNQHCGVGKWWKGVRLRHFQPVQCSLLIKPN